MRVAAIQHDIVWEDGAATRRHVEPMVAGAAAAGARPRRADRDVRAPASRWRPSASPSPTDGPTSTWIQRAGRVPRRLAVRLGGRAPGRRRQAPQRRSCWPGRTATTHRYAKIHPFTYAGEHEALRRRRRDRHRRRRRPAGQPLRLLRPALRRRLLAPGPDHRPLPLLRQLARGPPAHWQALLQARAIENQAYVRRRQPGRRGRRRSTYSGDSRIIDPLGEMLAGGARTETILLADVDAAEVAKVRDRFRFLPDRRTGAP